MRPPQGTIALLFTDVEGSTRLAGALGAAWAGVLADHHELVGAAIADEGGFVDGREGDAFFATFDDPAAAGRAAVAAQRRLHAHAWPREVGELRVRMGLHVGHVERHPTGYVGLEVHRAARVASAAHGGQLLLTAAARTLVGDAVTTEPVGVHRLKDFPTPEPLWTAVIDGRGAAAFPPPRAQRLRPTNLPSGAPALVGRESDVARVRAALLDDRERLVTLTGRGGAGKTTLALALAAELLDEHLGGVWLVRLAGVTAPADVLPAISATIGGDAGQPVADRLRDARGPVLLVLDNLEHLLGAAPDLAALLGAAPDLRILATSQAPLRLAATPQETPLRRFLQSERVIPVDALPLDAALELIDRVVARRGGAPPGDREALREVVELLDGLPLALELAAARLALLSPAALLERLRASTDVLKDAGREHRHQSLQATADWTLGLLADEPRALFERLGAFAGPVELDEIERVAGADGLDVLDALQALLDVALVRRVESGDGRVRFGLPQALREIAGRRLDAAPDGDRWRRAHAERQRDIAWAARGLGSTAGADFRAALNADAEAEAALRWATATGDPSAPRLRAARAALISNFGRAPEGYELVQPLLRSPSGDADANAMARIAGGYALLDIGRHDEALALLEATRAPDVDRQSRAQANVLLALLFTVQERHEDALLAAEQATELARGVSPAFLAGTLAMEAQARMFAGQLDRASALLEEAERTGAPDDVARVWFRHTFHGDLAVLAGRPAEALPHYRMSLEVAQELGDELQVVMDLYAAARALALLGRDADAIELLGLAEAHSAQIGARSLAAADQDIKFALDGAQRRLGPAAALEARALGHAIAPGRRVLRATQLIDG